MTFRILPRAGKGNVIIISCNSSPDTVIAELHLVGVEWRRTGAGEPLSPSWAGPRRAEPLLWRCSSATAEVLAPARGQMEPLPPPGGCQHR